MNKKNVELLAPAGNMRSFIAAINAGADAIYMGINKYNARGMAENFDIDSYIECIKIAHSRDVKVFLTLNTLLFDDELKDALDMLLKLYSKGLDAVIVQDIGLAQCIRETIPELPIHASTQMGIYNLEGVKYLESLGFSRVVLARELSLSEIERIVRNTNVEIEVFVHGALCVCMSGGCQMSALIGDRSANRGTCAQPCRQQYSLYKNGKEIVGNKYLLSKKDIFGIDYLDKLIEIGVTSLKIEGRNRSPEYVAGVVEGYRNEIDKKTVTDDEKNNILQLFNRSGQTPGYFEGILGKEGISYTTPKNTGLLFGTVMDYSKPYVKVKLIETIDLHDVIDIHSENEISSYMVTNIKNTTRKEENRISYAGDVVLLGDVKQRVNVGDIIYKTVNGKLNENLNKKYIDNIYARKKKIDISVVLNKEIFYSEFYLDGNLIRVNSDDKPETSIKNDIKKENIIDSFSKTEDTPYILNIIDNKTEPGLFLSKSMINNLRRNVIEKIEQAMDINIDVENKVGKKEKYMNRKISEGSHTTITNSLYIYNYDISKDYDEYYKEKYGKLLDRIYLDEEFLADNITEIQKYADKKIDVYAKLSNFTFENSLTLEENLKKQIKSGIKGIVISNLSHLELAIRLKKEHNIKLVANYTLNILNTQSLDFYIKQGIDEVIMGVDATSSVIESISKYVDVSIIKGVITAMTSRYCIISSFDNADKACNENCKNNDYYIVDNFNKKYNIVSDNRNHIMRLVRNNSKKYNDIHNISTIIAEI